MEKINLKGMEKIVCRRKQVKLSQEREAMKETNGN